VAIFRQREQRVYSSPDSITSIGENGRESPSIPLDAGLLPARFSIRPRRCCRKRLILRRYAQRGSRYKSKARQPEQMAMMRTGAATHRWQSDSDSACSACSKSPNAAEHHRGLSRPCLALRLADGQNHSVSTRRVPNCKRPTAEIPSGDRNSKAI
jgi:hypothetical protein